MDPFVGQIAVVGFDFAPTGWALCNGQLMPVSQNTALFSLLGTFYGGDGRSTFALPNLQGAMAISFGQGAGLSPYQIGEPGGEASYTLLPGEMPYHGHLQQATTALQASNSPVGAAFGSSSRGHGSPYYVAAPTPATSALMSPTAIGVTGGNQPHNNTMPSLVLNYIIALQGIFPARTQ